MTRPTREQMIGLGVISLGLALVYLAGCEAAARIPEDQVGQAQQAIDTGGKLLSPLTGGWSTIIASGLSALLPAAWGLNRQIVAKQRGDAIKELDESRVREDGHRAKDSVVTGKAKATVEKLTG